MFCSGLHLGWIFNKRILEFPFAASSSDVTKAMITQTFFLATCIGSMVGSFFMIKKSSKKLVYVRDVKISKVLQ